MKLKAVIFTIVAVMSSSLSVSAQIHDLFTKEADSLKVSFFGSVYIGAASITNRGWQSVMKGKHIDDEMKRRAEKKLRDKNLLGYEIASGTSALFSLGKRTHNDSVFGYLGIGFYDINELRFNKDVARLMLHGNMERVGDTIPLNSLYFNRYQYQHLTFGAFKLLSVPSGEAYVGFTAGVALGNTMISFNLDSAYLYTAPYGETVSLYTNMGFARSGSTHFSPFKYQGAGPVLGFHYFLKNKTGSFVGVSLDKLGFIRWNKSSISYKRDTTFSFEGIVIDNISNIEENLGDNLLTDTLDYWFLSYGMPRPYYTSLPARITFYGKYQLSSKPYAFLIHAFWSHNLKMRPSVTAGIEWQAGRNFSIAGTGTFGGFTLFTSGLEAEYNFFRYWTIKATALSLMPTLAGGNGSFVRQFYLSLTCNPAG